VICQLLCLRELVQVHKLGVSEGLVEIGELLALQVLYGDDVCGFGVARIPQFRANRLPSRATIGRRPLTIELEGAEPPFAAHQLESIALRTNDNVHELAAGEKIVRQRENLVRGWRASARRLVGARVDLVERDLPGARRLRRRCGSLAAALVRVSTPSARATYFGGEVALDFMFWPTRCFGLWVEPCYEFTFQPSGVSHGLGITGGLLIGW
jgi:hypothetical protein